MKIKELKLYAQDLSSQIEFYSHRLGVELLEQSSQKASFNIGNTRLTLLKSNHFTPYHFAINIPCNKATEALKWLKERVEILKDGDSEIQDFKFWNAEAIYFYDKDKNIVELIARNDLGNESDVEFSAKCFLEISEIGVPVKDIEKTSTHLNDIVKIPIYDGAFDRFCAIGDENGLFICINKEIKDWYPTGDKAYSSGFEIELIQNGKSYILAFKNERIEINH